MARPLSTVNLAEKLGQIDAYWTPKIVAQLNGQDVRLVKVKGTFDWHHHAGEDELFMVLHGTLRIRLRGQDDLLLGPGELAVIPRGVEHQPVADEEVHLLLFEPSTTLNTGNVRSKRTQETLERI